MFVAQQIDIGSPVEAKRAVKGLTYCCRDCLEKVILVRPKVRRPHFRHRRASECASAGETWQHAEAKGAILDVLRQRGIQAFPEVECLTVEGDRRADVLAWVPSDDANETDADRRIAFEVQYSQIGDYSLDGRTSAYMSAKIPVIWIPVIDKSRFEAVLTLKSDSRFHMAPDVRLPLWIDRIEDIHGDLWIYVPQSAAFFKLWRLTCYRYIESHDYHNSNGEECSSGGYWKAYERQADAILYGPVAFGDLKIQRVWRPKNSKIISRSGWKRLVNLVDPKFGPALKCPIVRRFVYEEESGYSHPQDHLVHEGKEVQPIFTKVASFPSLLADTD